MSPHNNWLSFLHLYVHLERHTPICKYISTRIPLSKHMLNGDLPRLRSNNLLSRLNDGPNQYPL
uniref:Uncharacterized protein n=1 Tax=Utricularia reniformis TaxID=192314 RepID=A0A1Y0B2Y7_9LAMI|nr:hypothetical protein AEK19_MT1576 [Utricularia reniformis]ART31761.1 hypothetical protein AEK19_MT1576 [Utricularia reniformis]